MKHQEVFIRCKELAETTCYRLKKQLAIWCIKNERVRSDVCADTCVQTTEFSITEISEDQNTVVESVELLRKVINMLEQSHYSESSTIDPIHMVEEELLPPYFTSLCAFCNEFYEENLLRKISTYLNGNLDIETKSSNDIVDEVLEGLDRKVIDDVSDPLFNLVNDIKRYSVGDIGRRLKSVTNRKIGDYLFFPKEGELFDYDYHRHITTLSGRYVKECIFPGIKYHGLVIPAIVNCKD